MATRFHRPAARVNGKTRGAFHRNLVHWYRHHYRKLPWRATRDPYKIWVSEIMLQQTRVEVVLDYYNRWIRAFPTVESLARAPFSRVLKLWEGLGYYSRARNLHRAAKLTARRSVPSTAEEWQQLPGIGRYTAGAIASIAFGERAPLVDGNVARLFARVFGIRADVTKPVPQKRLWQIAEELLPATNVGDFNQALMELGALVCTPANPRCEVCPLRPVCVAFAHDQQNALPNRGPRRRRQAVTHDVLLVKHDGQVLLRQRPETGLLAGLWELPPGKSRQHLLSLRHTIMDRQITLRVFLGGKADGRWFSRRQLARVAMPAAQRRALVRIFSAQDKVTRTAA
jgi:A/G-specific adenine glycosylase